MSELWLAAWSWLQRNSTGIGVVLSLIGFAITWIQLARTKKAAVAAQKAAVDAKEAVARVDTIADIASAQAGIKEVQVALRGRRFETALLRSQSLREILFRLRKREGFESEERQAVIQKMVTDLRSLQGAMEQVLHDPHRDFAPPKINRVLSDAAVELATWSEELRYDNREFRT